MHVLQREVLDLLHGADRKMLPRHRLLELRLEVLQNDTEGSVCARHSLLNERRTSKDDFDGGILSVSPAPRAQIGRSWAKETSASQWVRIPAGEGKRGESMSLMFGRVVHFGPCVCHAYVRKWKFSAILCFASASASISTLVIAVAVAEGDGMAGPEEVEVKQWLYIDTASDVRYRCAQI